MPGATVWGILWRRRRSSHLQFNLSRAAYGRFSTVRMALAWASRGWLRTISLSPADRFAITGGFGVGFVDDGHNNTFGNTFGSSSDNVWGGPSRRSVDVVTQGRRLRCSTRDNFIEVDRLRWSRYIQLSNRPGANRTGFYSRSYFPEGAPRLLRYSSFADGCRTCYAAPVSLT
jgi:hypothetical protein